MIYVKIIYSIVITGLFVNPAGLYLSNIFSIPSSLSAFIVNAMLIVAAISICGTLLIAILTHVLTGLWRIPAAKFFIFLISTLWVVAGWVVALLLCTSLTSSLSNAWSVT